MITKKTAINEQMAERRLYHYLGELLGHERPGLASYGLRFDPKDNRQYIGVDFEPNIPSNVLARVPDNVDDVDVHVRRVSLQLEGVSS